MTDKLTKANSKRTIAFKRLQEAHECGLQVKNDESLKSTFLARANTIDAIYSEFQSSHNTVISLINDDEFSNYDQMRVSADLAYYGVLSLKYDLSLNDSSSQSVNRSNIDNANLSNHRSLANLPKLALPHFDGSYKLWPTFYDLFNSLIHNNSDLSNVEKFQYLLTSLDKEPLTLIKGIPLTDANYILAYEKLERRYQNKRILASHYYNEIFNAAIVLKANSHELRKLLSIFSENVAALRVMKFPVDQWDFLLFNMLLNKLDTKTRTDFELEHSLSPDLPTYRQLISFLERHCIALESVQYTAIPYNIKGQTKYVNNKKPISNFMISTDQHSNKSSKCFLCSSSHPLYKCEIFLSKTPQDRFSIAKQQKLCVNCLVSPHAMKNCGSPHKCRICKCPHHTTLHFDRKSIPIGAQPNIVSSVNPTKLSSEPSVGVNPTSSITTSLANIDVNTDSIITALSLPQSTILLSTCEVEVKDIRGNFTKIRILLDTGSMANFVSESCVQRLGLSKQGFSIPVEGLGGTSMSANSGKVQCLMKPCKQIEPIFSFEAIVLPKVCSDQPKVQINISELTHLQHLKLADSKFYIPGPIDMLIGAELTPFILKAGRVYGHPNQPVALETVFGYILQGKTSCISNSAPSSVLVNCHVALETTVDMQLRKFWEIEEISNSSHLSSEDKKCEEIYKLLTVRDAKGRFSVPLPFRQENPVFLDTYSQAYRRFCMLEKRFEKSFDLRTKYCDFMQDYLEKGHMSLVPSEHYRSPSAYYIAHHAIFKDQISGSEVLSKIRVVFNASLRDKQGVSLNDTLLVGPKLQRDIASLLLKFRFYSYVFICDIKQMYRQINVSPDFWDYQRILWRFSPSEPLQEYHLCTVTYGVSSSPYLALRTLLELAAQIENSFPKVAEALRTQFYMDDALLGANDLKSALNLQSDLIKVMKKGGFELGKWASNHSDLLAHIDPSDCQDSYGFDKEEPSFIKILGLKWDPLSDMFSYSYIPFERSCTKRHILSDVSRIYDPLGFVSPCLLLAKRLLQRLWELNIPWDEILPIDITDLWTTFKTELPQLSDIKIARYLGSNDVSRIELHGFCDASQVGYASVVYFRIEEATGNIKTFLVSAKCKVAPLKTLSIARLELLAAVLLANLIHFVQKSYEGLIIFDAIYAWSDSMITLAWLSSSPSRWKPFIANRVNHVQEIISISNWYYVPSLQNPADCASRGQTPSQLLDTSIWWSGPLFLSMPKSAWPSRPTDKVESDSDVCRELQTEERKTALVITVVAENIVLNLLNRFSSLLKIRRILAYILRFIHNCRSSNRLNGVLTPLEVDSSLQPIIRIVQRDVFSDIFLKLQQNVLLPKPFRKLAPFVDSSGLLRVGGRLKKSSFNYDLKHPILLPKTHRLTELIIEWVHCLNLHPGLKTLQYLLLQQYWILSPKAAVYKCLSRCIKCFRSKPKSYNPYMADLPSFRVSQLKPFSSVCVDFAGPFSLLMSKHRGVKTFKGYVCLFVCTATKAIHLEATSDLSSECFLAAFRRFIARRGRCTSIVSDQGTNFKGANNQLLEFAQNAAQKLDISWNFNPPASPHFNGLAEAGVKSFKSYFYRVIGSQILSFEEFYTILTQIEAILNSRPLCPLSSDPNDLQSLTPAHFLVFEPLNNSIPEPDLSHLSLNKLSRWQLLQRLQRDFWKRWSLEYINTLQERHKWTKRSPPVSRGDLVIIKNDQQAPLQWELGRIIDVFPGQDGVVRVVAVRTSRGIMRRPVVKICPLPGNQAE